MVAKPVGKSPLPLLGAHMSIDGGTPEAIKRGESIGCTAIQIFLKNSNRWKGKAIGEKEAADFRAGLAASRIRSVFGHNSYLVNLASNRDDLFAKSIEAMVDEIERASALGVPFIVIHPGSHVGQGEEWGLKRIAEGVAEICRRTAAHKVAVAFETTAGQGTNLGYRFEHLAALLDGAPDKARVGVCFDTCHVFAAGYELRDRRRYQETVRALDEIVGLENLLAIHLNDSKGDLGSRLDRHEHIGKGRLGLEAFRNVLNDPRFEDVPKVLETPKGPDMNEDVENLKVLRGLIAAKQRDLQPHSLCPRPLRR